MGTHQLHDKLRADSRVVLIEEQHILELAPTQLAENPELCVVDVSFISVIPVLRKIKDLLLFHATVIALVKPQFEVGPKFLKKGVVRSEEKQKEAVTSVRRAAEEFGFTVVGESLSHLKGPKGNQEYFLHLILSPK